MKMQRLNQQCLLMESKQIEGGHCRCGESSGVTAILLRYFNPIGSHPSIEIEITRWGTTKSVPFIAPKQEWATFGLRR
jgi:UDP-glucose 4-epimerase